MTSVTRRRRPIRERLSLAVSALRLWTGRQIAVALVAGLIVFLLIGVATVLIPNPIFGRDIPPVWWNYPVLVITSVLSGMLIATYVRSGDVPAPRDEDEETKSGKFGMVGGVLAWFAVGCPVCNKIALLALGYSGAITWFTPIQPFLAIGAMILTGIALMWRLEGQVACPVREKVGASS